MKNSNAVQIPYNALQKLYLGWKQGDSKSLPELVRELLEKYNGKRLVTVAEFARMAGNKHPETVRVWIRDEIVKATNISVGKKRPTYRIEVAELKNVVSSLDALPI